MNAEEINKQFMDGRLKFIQRKGFAPKIAWCGQEEIEGLYAIWETIVKITQPKTIPFGNMIYMGCEIRFKDGSGFFFQEGMMR